MRNAEPVQIRHLASRNRANRDLRARFPDFGARFSKARFSVHVQITAENSVPTPTFANLLI